MKKNMITSHDTDELDEIFRQKRNAFTRGFLGGLSAPMNLFGNHNQLRIEYDFDSVAHAWQSVELSLNHALIEYERGVQLIEEEATKEERSESSTDSEEDNTLAL